MAKQTMFVGEYYQSNKYGSMLVTHYLNSGNVTIEFLSTGFVTKATADNIRKGDVCDKSRLVRVGDIYSSNSCGKMEVIGYYGSQKVTVKFINTGYTTSSQSTAVRYGRVRDPLSPSHCGVGYIGVGVYSSHLEGVGTKCYKVWKSMIERCYSTTTQERQPTYIGCTVDDDWHNFQNFALWFHTESNYKEGLHLDKDIKIAGNKIYSEEACMFVTISNNNIKAHAKTYEFINPMGEVVYIYNLEGHCTYYGLDRDCMQSVYKGSQKHHKGYTKA